MKIHFSSESLRCAVLVPSPYNHVQSRVLRSVRLALHLGTLNFLKVD